MEKTKTPAYFFPIFDQNKPVKVFVNSQEVIIFAGARVCDAVLAYSKASYKMLTRGTLTAADHLGNITANDGPLGEGQIIVLIKTRPHEIL
jgi:hypothetical protein